MQQLLRSWFSRRGPTTSTWSHFADRPLQSSWERQSMQCRKMSAIGFLKSVWGMLIATCFAIPFYDTESLVCVALQFCFYLWLSCIKVSHKASLHFMLQASLGNCQFTSMVSSWSAIKPSVCWHDFGSDIELQRTTTRTAGKLKDGNKLFSVGLLMQAHLSSVLVVSYLVAERQKSLEGIWKSASMVSSHLLDHFTVWQTDFDLSQQQWSLLNRFQSVQGHCGSTCRNYN